MRFTAKIRLLICFIFITVGSIGFSGTKNESQSKSPANSQNDLHLVIDKTEREFCIQTVQEVVRAPNRERLKAFCDEIKRLPSCLSIEKKPIHHSESISNNPNGKRILVLGMIHGDEPLAGEMALEWAERLKKISGARNSWRVVPLLNPDGFQRKTRGNANGVDLNRNFPTKDWEEAALDYWRKRAKSDPRRYPGESAASEPETRCAIAHIKDFKPDFVVSIHTPYRVLDFDGPKMAFPKYGELPWRALGNFPGSLGRYMWRDYKIPVLTIELGDKMVNHALLQDVIGGFAIEAVKRSGKKEPTIFETM